MHGKLTQAETAEQTNVGKPEIGVANAVHQGQEEVALEEIMPQWEEVRRHTTFAQRSVNLRKQVGGIVYVLQHLVGKHDVKGAIGERPRVACPDGADPRVPVFLRAGFGKHSGGRIQESRCLDAVIVYIQAVQLRLYPEYDLWQVAVDIRDQPAIAAPHIEDPNRALRARPYKLSG
jgi:hypothetical protein